jgi:UDP-glucuronate 4-epimerase
MPALVTGCAGFVGSHLADSLLADGHAVVGVDSFDPSYPRTRKEENVSSARDHEMFELVEIDLADDDLAPIVADADVIFHLAGQPGARTSWGRRFDGYLRNNVVGTQRLLEACAEQPEKRFVFASSSSIYGNAESLPTAESALPAPHSPYGVTKLNAEHLCAVYQRNHGVDAVSLRYFSVYGPRQRPDMAFDIFCRAIRADEPIEIFGDGKQSRDFTFVADIIEATRAAADAQGVAGRVFNVGAGSRVSLDRAIELLARISGREVEVRRRESQRGDVRDTGADIAAASASLGFSPTTTLAEGLRRQWEWTASGPV